MIRRFDIADAPSVYETEKLCFPDPWSENGIRAEADNALGVSLVCEEDGIIGYIFGDCDGASSYISRIAVHPAHRRKGTAAELMRIFMQLTSGDISLEVRQANTGAPAFYEKMGFERIALRKGFYSDPPDDAAVMILRR